MIKIMKLFKRPVIILLVTLLIVTVPFIVANWNDSDPNPEVTQISFNFSRKADVTPAYLEAYKRLLGLASPKEVDPLDRGEKLYQQLSRVSSGSDQTPFGERITFENALYFSRIHGFWPRDLLGDLKAEIKNAEEKNREILSRADVILKLGGIATDIPPKFTTHSADILLLLDVIRFQLAKISLQIHEGQLREPLDALLLVQNFSSSLVSFRDSTLVIKIGLLAMDNIRSLLQESVKQYPALASLYSRQYKRKFTLNLDFEKIRMNIIQIETFYVKGVVDEMLASKKSNFLEWLESSYLHADQSNTFLTYVVWYSPLWLRSLLFQKNETINEHYENMKLSTSQENFQSTKECPRDQESKPKRIFTYIRNPIGKYLTDSLWNSQHCYMMARNFRTIRDINQFYSHY